MPGFDPIKGGLPINFLGELKESKGFKRREEEAKQAILESESSSARSSDTLKLSEDEPLLEGDYVEIPTAFVNEGLKKVSGELRGREARGLTKTGTKVDENYRSFSTLRPEQIQEKKDLEERIKQSTMQVEKLNKEAHQIQENSHKVSEIVGQFSIITAQLKDTQNSEALLNTGLELLMKKSIKISIPENKDLQKRLQPFVNEFFNEIKLMHKRLNTPSSKSIKGKNGQRFPGLKGEINPDTFNSLKELILVPISGIDEGATKAEGFKDLVRARLKKIAEQIKMIKESIALDTGRIKLMEQAETSTTE